MSRTPSRIILSCKYQQKLRYCFLKLFTIAIIIFTCIASISIADEDDTDSETIGEVVVTADKEKSKTIIDKPGSSSVVIPLSEKRDQFVELKDILTSQMGIHVREFSGTGHTATVNMRGVSAKGVLIMIDGVPLNGLWATGVDLSNIPLSGFEEIEILKGGSSAFYGDSALGGAINLKTTSSTERKNHISFTLGSFNLFETNAILNFHNSTDDVMLVLQGMSSLGNYPFLNDNGTSLDDSDDFADTRENNEIGSIGYLLKYSHEMANDSRFTFVTEINHSQKGIPGLVTFPSTQARQVDDRIFVQALMEKENVCENTDALFRFFLRRNTLDYEDKLGEATGLAIDTHRTDQLFGISSEITKFNSTGNGLITGGIELSNENFSESNNYKPGRSKISLSLERESYFDDGDFVLHLASRLDAVESFNPAATFRIAGKLKKSENAYWHASLGNSFRTPGFDELYDNLGLVVGNPDLTPEKGFDFDLGWEYSDDADSFGITAFHNRLKNQIVYNLIGGHRFKPFNIGKSDMTGIEVAWQKCIENFNFNGNYTWLDARNRNDDPASKNKKLPSRPEHELFSQISFDIKPVFFECDYHLSSGNFVTFSNTVELKKRSKIDFRMKWKTDNYAVTAEVRNLFDENNVDVRGFPLPGRAFFLTLSHDF